jgi:hypothetical protein
MRRNVLVACRNTLDMGMNLAKIPARLYHPPGPHPCERVGRQSTAPDGSSDEKWDAGA